MRLAVLITFELISLPKGLLFYDDTRPEFCTSADDIKCQNENMNFRHWTTSSSTPERRYLLYAVNRGEGFNLCRDVYLRISVLLKQLREHDSHLNWVLVLPPWGPLYHWKTAGEMQYKIPWSEFFDVNCMRNFIPVVEFSEYVQEHGSHINTIYYLQHDDWNGGEWKDKVEIEECKSEIPYRKESDNFFGWFWGYEGVLAKNVVCVTVLGQANLLIPLISRTKGAVMIDHAEVVLHDNFGDSVYWQSRQSLRFAKHLREIGDRFRLTALNSTDENDNTVMTNCQLLKHESGSAVGGNYISVHLRRQDFLQSRKNDVPSLDGTAKQLKKLQKTLNITTVFVASDAPLHEINYLKSLVPEIVQFIPSKQELREVRDGGIAIIDQWICAHARYFVGTHESTFSFRIQEEREILGFDPDTTFNRLCGDEQKKCEQPARWRIVYD